MSSPGPKPEIQATVNTVCKPTASVPISLDKWSPMELHRLQLIDCYEFQSLCILYKKWTREAQQEAVSITFPLTPCP